MPALAHFFHIQPSEARRLKMRELGALARYKAEFEQAMKEAGN